MNANLSLATCGFPNATRFVLVNDRVLRNDEHCALCGGTIEKGYVRDFKTGLIYCEYAVLRRWDIQLHKKSREKSVMKTAMFVGATLDGPLGVILEPSQRRLP